MSNKISGVRSREVREYEIRHRGVARRAAAEGMILLKNEEHLLPLPRETRVALYGSGALFPIKGGSGSGDVNSRETVNLLDGMAQAGYEIANRSWLEEYRKQYEEARINWRNTIWDKIDQMEKEGREGGLWAAYTTTPFLPPAGDPVQKAEADVALYVHSRTAGEGADRFASPGDYYLTGEEEAFISRLCECYSHVALILNLGGIVDLEFADKYPAIQSILYVSQPGMEAGNAMADVISGAVTPSGKLTDSWARAYEDYPNSETFSHNNGNVTEEFYEEGIYVGYRYFDTFEVPVRYPFGFGLSYTSFSMDLTGLSLKKPGTGNAGEKGGCEKAADETGAGRTNLCMSTVCAGEDENLVICARACVKNTGEIYSGREVAQLYVSCPQGSEGKEFRRLAAFAKTGLLAPGETQELELCVSLKDLASYDEALSAWVLEEGAYVFLLGADIQSGKPAGILQVKERILLEKTEAICPLQRAEDLEELLPDEDRMKERREVLLRETEAIPAKSGLKAPLCISLSAEDVTTRTITYDGAYEDTPQQVRDFVDTLSQEQLILLATGDVAAGQGSIVGAAGSRVPGSAAQTSACAADQGVPEIVLADGPAGLRLNQEYRMVNGIPGKTPFEKAMENGFLYRGKEDTQGDLYYQFCTAIPVGTLLAQTWDPELVAECGIAVAEEMEEFDVALWLAPGMNIHRNPLCGRNFEYFSEDPLLAGMMAAAMTKGVQTKKSCGTTIKHFACNNQEDNRMASDSILSERTLREIYLRGFEIAVKTSQPLSIMTSYNLVNGVHAANNFDLCTKAARCEWGFRGVIMTDWGTTNRDETCTAAGCMRAGNDLVMPGKLSDHDNLRQALADGSLDIKDLKRCAARTVNIVWGVTEK